MLKQLIDFIVTSKLRLSELKDNKIGFMIYDLDTQPSFDLQELRSLVVQNGWYLKVFPQSFDSVTGKPSSERIYCGPSKDYGISGESEVKDFLTRMMSKS